MESRLTFREKTEVCWQKQLRDHFTTEGAPEVPHLDIKRAFVRPVSYALAKQIIYKYEWLGTMASNVSRAYGIFFGLYCGGVTTWAPAGYNLPSLAKSFGVTSDQLAYLGRGACVHWSPPGTNSKLIAYSLKFEHKRGSKIAVAFSDSDAGEIGTVYQASNWTYIGKGSTWKQWVSGDGRVWSFNRFTAKAKLNRMTTTTFRKYLISAGWKEQNTNPKGRYVFILDKTDKRLVELIKSMREPYPKRPKQAMAGSTGTAEGQHLPGRST